MIFSLAFRNFGVKFSGLNWNSSFTTGESGFNMWWIMMEATSKNKPSVITICSSSALIGL
jgi:hypothetical protein